MYLWRRPRLFDRHIKAEVHSAYPNLYLSSLKLQRNHAKGRVKKIRVHNFLLFILFLFLIAFCFLISLFFFSFFSSFNSNYFLHLLLFFSSSFLQCFFLSLIVFIQFFSECLIHCLAWQI